LILSSSTLLDLGARRMNNCRFKRQNLNWSSSALLDLGARRMNNCRFKRQNLMPSLVQSIIIN
jgi:ribosomal protein L30/L7E